jgi:hypothetical protein
MRGLVALKVDKIYDCVHVSQMLLTFISNYCSGKSHVHFLRSEHVPVSSMYCTYLEMTCGCNISDKYHTGRYCSLL